MIESADRKSAGGVWAVLLMALIFAAIAPTLTLLEFSGGSENLNAATVQEMHRGGPWLVPSLNGIPRLAKPPLTAWISALVVSRDDIAQLNSPEQSTRDAAFDTFAFKLRWPALLAGCLLVLAVYCLGRTLESHAFGFTAAVVCASSILFLRFIRNSTTDVQLALWVGIANAFFASLIFSSVRIWKLIALGLAIGLALMSKGPVALVQTVLPWMVFLLLDSTTRKAFHRQLIVALSAAICTTAISLAIALPWPIYAVAKFPKAIDLWWMEVTREGATTLAPDPWYIYLSILILVMPWIGFFIAGVVMALRNRTNRPALFALSLLLVPILLMSLAKDKNDRYLLPLLPAVSILTAIALKPQFRPPRDQNNADRFLRILHIAILAIMIIGVPVGGAAGLMKTVEGESWYSGSFALIAVILLPALLAASWFWNRRRPGVLIPATLAIMLLLQGVFILGYARDQSGRSEMKPIADAIMNFSPQAPVWYFDPRASYKPMPQDLSIYLNRTVPEKSDGTSIRNAERGQIIVMLQREKETDPVINGWRPLASLPWGRRSWWAFVRDGE